MKEVFDIVVTVQEVQEVITAKATVKMLVFTAVCEGTGFVGRTLPGAVDRQIIQADGTGVLSARYLMEGVDAGGQPCKVYIDNTGTIDKDGEIVTSPLIYTDSNELQHLQDSKLYGKVTFEEGTLHVHISVSDDFIKAENN